MDVTFLSGRAEGISLIIKVVILVHIYPQLFAVFLFYLFLYLWNQIQGWDIYN